MKRVTIRVPATTANLAAGFDVLGCALGLYNTLSFTPAERLSFSGCDEQYQTTENLAYVAYERVWRELRRSDVPPVHIHIQADIPVCRGLGSSAALIAAGAMAANIMAGKPFDKRQLLSLTTEIEGHPDNLAPALLGPIAVSAYSYMALVPVIQPPIMKALTTEKERQIVMKPLREVSKKEKIIFPIVVTIFVALLVPSAAPLIACLMFGNLAKECGVTDRLSKTMQNELMNIVTIFLGVSVGATATGATFLSPKTLMILGMGIVAFGFGTAGGVLLAKFMNLFLKEKINPLIGSAGVSAVPMAARVSQKVGQEANPGNFLLMHAMGPNVAGVIGSAIAAGVLISLFG